MSGMPTPVLNVPGPHVEQLVPAANPLPVEKVPCSHREQFNIDTKPDPVAYEPAIHWTQFKSVLPTTGLYVPLSHKRQLVEPNLL